MLIETPEREALVRDTRREAGETRRRPRANDRASTNDRNGVTANAEQSSDDQNESPFDDRLPNEDELVARAATDADAFAMLYRHYVPRIHAFAMRRAGSRHIADDVTSATFEKAMRNLRTFKPRGGGFGAWLFRIASNELIDHHRREARPRSDRGQRAMSMMVDSDDLDDDPVIAGDDRELLREALTKLSPRHQQAISLRYLSELTNEEAAEAMGLTRPHMAVTLHRAIAALRKELAGSLT